MTEYGGIRKASRRKPKASKQERLQDDETTFSPGSPDYLFSDGQKKLRLSPESFDVNSGNGSLSHLEFASRNKRLRAVLMPFMDQTALTNLMPMALTRPYSLAKLSLLYGCSATGFCSKDTRQRSGDSSAGTTNGHFGDPCFTVVGVTVIDKIASGD
ncbi:hypothetical protein GOBAR_AA33485 [Gossypium barbadense]|uniref:Uncharacterized protein n=1 Tax=Gossypium barbadense TaxID=3634 RepID=A0A2P5W815_GOSBA|nr:hypothetical protein GOBAR_AA33485 [Gossypium barbadense]